MYSVDCVAWVAHWHLPRSFAYLNPSRLPTIGSMAKRILIVDDAAVIRDLIGLLLAEYEDFVVTMATNGRQALEMLQTNKFDLAIVDLNMPEMNGVELIKAIRADARTRAMPVIVCTANDHAQMMNEAESLGIEAYVLKPFKNKELLLLVSQLVG